MTNHRISRVFLQDGKDFNEFIISSLDMILTDRMPSLEAQVRQSLANKPTTLALRIEKLDNHWMVSNEARPVRIADSYDELKLKCYEYAVKEAQRKTTNYSAASGRNYVFIDVTSRADIRAARELCGEITYKQ